VINQQIDHDALERLRRFEQGMRRTVFLDLSDTYVSGEGDNPIAMIIGEAPGAQEESKRRPFVGDSGIVLRELMSFAGLYTGQTPELGVANCWLTNVVKFRPPRNRTPTDQEISTARNGLNMEWRAIGKPKLIIPVGGAALRATDRSGSKLSILKWAAKPYNKTSEQGTRVTIWPMVHPSFVIRSKDKRLQEIVENDWEKLGRWIKKESTSPIGKL